MEDVAVAASTGADATQNHKGCSALVPALANVWTICLCADRVQIQGLDELFESPITR